MPQVISLYCGAGGIDEGLKQVGIKTTLAIDVEKDCLETIKLNNPDCELICGKVGDYIESLPQAKIVTGGPPCPEFSRAKSNRTFDTCEVNNFWKAVEHCKPEFHLMENVQDIIQVLKLRNYLINCADYGVPQTRIRRFYTNIPLPKPTHAKTPSSDLFGNHLKKWVSVREALGLDGMLQNRTLFGWKNKNSLRQTNKPSSTILTDGSDNGIWFIEDRKTTMGEKDFRKYSIDEPSNTLLADASQWFVSSYGHSTQNREKITRSIEEPSDTVVVANEMRITNYAIKSVKKIRNRNQHLKLDHHRIERKITNEELAILQGFPKDFKFYGNKTSVRRQIGNAVPPPVIKAFFEQIVNEVIA